MKVRIFRPTKNPMQSGRANARRWVVESEPVAPKEIDPLMGWIGSRDTQGQVRLLFNTKEEAVAYAARNNLAYEVFDGDRAKIKPKSYSDNFKFDKLEFGRG
jgi:hypothetical protein